MMIIYEDKFKNQESIKLSFFLDKLKTKKIKIERYELEHDLEIFKENGVLELINNGTKLPIVVLDGRVVLYSRYPKNYEILDFLGLDRNILSSTYVNKTRKF